MVFPQKEDLPDKLYNHVELLACKIGERHLWKEKSLEMTKEYLESVLVSYGYSPWQQKFRCYGKEVSNIIAEKKSDDRSIIVIGAHYDTVPGTPGADDNASAVAGVLELPKLFKNNEIKKNINFVLFVNEEPPFFGSNNMGSMVYAKYLRENDLKVIK